LQLKEFDTPDQRFEKLYRFMGEVLMKLRPLLVLSANINSVHYNVGNDIPSQLLKNLTQTLGWVTNFSPISNERVITGSIYNSTKYIPGLQIGPTPEEINYQFYQKPNFEFAIPIQI
jgi:hypothetical protein